MTERDHQSLMAGRRSAPLDQGDQRAVTAVFFALDREVNFRYEEGAYTHFEVEVDEDGTDFGIVIFGPDIYPGTGLADPNSSLSMKAAVAHEMAHFHRWRDRSEISPLGSHRDLDEAITSLDAARRYSRLLSPYELEQLVSDALQRLAQHWRVLEEIGS